MKAVFDTKTESIYDDDIAHRYHFPPRYLDTVSKCVGDWVVFRQPRAGGGSKSYFAAGQVTHIELDASKPGYRYAIIANFLPFGETVPWLQNGRYAEEALRNLENVSKLGLFMRGHSVRPLSESDFSEIVLAGLHRTLPLDNTGSHNLDASHFVDGALAECEMPQQERRIVEMLVNRRVRDAAFRRHICLAYDNRCAVTGLQLTDLHGMAEVQAAHIWPVFEGGPDTIQNGLALSGTAHWLFDRHLISLTDEYRLLVCDARVPKELRALLEPRMGRVHLPMDKRQWPNLVYVARHRKAFAATSASAYAMGPAPE